MRRLSFLVVSGLAILALAGCAGATSEETDAVVQQPAKEDVLEQLGPDEMPNRDEDPEQFFYWRVDQMFKAMDKDADGMISRDEYSGGAMSNFDRMDGNSDGFLTKREVVDDSVRRGAVTPGQSPAQ